MALFKANKVTLAMLLVASSAFSYNALADTQKITSVEGITEYRLDNGLKLLLFPDQSKETVTVNITYHVGSKHENYGETGMAHLLEHMVFKGSPKHKDIPSELSSHGARPNGSTWTDRTNYFETFAATEQNINWALDMEADRMVNSFIAKKDLDSEMTVVRNEFERGENSPFRVTLQRMMGAAYEWHNYGKSTIGARADIENVPIEKLQAFYRKYYQPDNATLIVAGKFKPEDMLKKVEHYFGNIKKPNRKLNKLYTQEPAQDGERQVIVRRVGDVQMLGAVYHIPAGSHPDYPAIELLNNILSDTPSGRLHKALVENKLASRSFGFNFQWQEPGVAIFMAEVDKKADLNKTQAAFLSTIEQATEQPFTQKELDKAKATVAKAFEVNFNSSERVALELSEWLGMGDWRLMFLNRDRLEQVTLEDINRVAKKYFVRNNRTLGKFLPAEKAERVEIPQVTSVADMLKGYKGKKAIAQGEAFDPSPKNIDSRTKLTTLKNGAKVALLEKKTRGESVVVRMNIHFGKLASLMNKQAIGETLGSMLMRGTKHHTREQLQTEFDKLKSQVRIGGDVNSAYASIRTTKANLAKTLDLVAEVLQQPAFDQKEFEQFISTAKVDIEKQLQDPQALAFTELQHQHSKGLAKSHPNYVPSLTESLEMLQQVKLADLAKFHNKFYHSKDMEISVVGDFDEQATVKQLNQLFADFNNQANYQRIGKSYTPFSKDDKQFNTPDKENAVFIATTNLNVNQDDADAPALTLGNYMFGGGFLNSRLATRLRQKDGLSYGAGSFMNINPLDKVTAFGAYAICAPQNLNKVEVGFKEELARMLKDGFTDEELAKAKSGLLQSYKVSRSQDGELVGKLASNLYLNRNMQWSQAFEDKIKALTPAQVLAAMQKHLKPEMFSIIKAGDQSKIK